MSIRENIAARNRLTAAISPDSDGPYGTQDRDSTEMAFGWVYKQPGMVRYEDCTALLKRVWVERGEDDGVALLQRFGVSKLSELYMGMFDQFYRYARTVLDYGVSPALGWTSEADIEDWQRDRWLLWHDDSGCRWEVRGKLADELADGSVVDVSGLPEHEKQWAAMPKGEPVVDEL